MSHSDSDYDMSDGDDEEDSIVEIVPEHLGNQDTLAKLAFIDDLKKFAINELVNLPQLVVIGDQSSGKSSVLQAITRLSFPIDDVVCTRFPTEVSLQRASDHSLELSITKSVRAFDILTQVPAQKKWLENQSTRIEKFNAKWQGKNAEGTDFGKIISEAREAIMGRSTEPKQPANKANAAHDKKNLLSDATLKIVKKGPGEINITIVDIPGLVSSTHPAHRMASALVEHYITNPRSIVLAVTHPANMETQDVFEIIANIKDWKSRVIGVITKCDKIEVDGDDWVYKAIRNQESEFNRCLENGWFALRNLSPSERKANSDSELRDKKEEEFFKQKTWADLNRDERLGIKNLKDALTTMHNQHVTRSIPELIPEIGERLRSVGERIVKLGPPRITPESQMNCLVNLATQYSLRAKDAIDGHNDRLPNCPEIKIRTIVRDRLEKFRDTMNKMFEKNFYLDGPGFSLESVDEKTWETSILKSKYLAEIEKCITDNRGMEMVDEVNTAVLRRLWCNLTPFWKTLTDALINDLVGAIGRSVEAVLVAVCDEESLRINIRNLLEADVSAVTEHANRELGNLLNDEKSGLIITLNKWSVYRLQALSDKRVEFMVDRLDKLKRQDRDVVKSQVKAYIARHARVQAILTTHDKLASYYETGMLRFVDNVCHQICERHLLGENSPLRSFAPDLVTKKFQGNEQALQRIAGENKEQMEERDRLQVNHKLLKEAMDKAKEYKLNIGVQGMGLRGD